MRVKLLLLVIVGLLAVPLGTVASGSTTKYTPPNLAFSIKGPAKVVAGQLNSWRITIRNKGAAARRRITVRYLLDSGVTVDASTTPKPSRVKPLASGQHMMIWHLGRLAGKTKKFIFARAKMPDISDYPYTTYCFPVQVIWKGILIDEKVQWPCPAFVASTS
jgi:hypothetical protein